MSVLLLLMMMIMLSFTGPPRGLPEAKPGKSL